MGERKDNDKMRVLVACEESQRVTIAFRNQGHEAYSCDLIECSGGHPEWHLQCDVTQLLKMRWDMIIAFPPCTHLAVSGARWFKKKREDGRQREAIEFFCRFLDADCDYVAVENPVNIVSGNEWGGYISQHFPELCKKYNLPRKPTQVIQPYMFGDEARKKTCLWLKGFPQLKPTKIVSEGTIVHGNYCLESGAWFARDESGKILSWNDKKTAIIRSKTYPGVAKAMAEQWGTMPFEQRLF